MKLAAGKMEARKGMEETRILYMNQQVDFIQDKKKKMIVGLKQSRPSKIHTYEAGLPSFPPKQERISFLETEIPDTEFWNGWRGAAPSCIVLRKVT